MSNFWTGFRRAMDADLFGAIRGTPQIHDASAAAPRALVLTEEIDYRVRFEFGLPIQRPSWLSICPIGDIDLGPLLPRCRKPWRPKVTRQQRRARRWQMRHACRLRVQALAKPVPPKLDLDDLLRHAQIEFQLLHLMGYDPEEKGWPKI